MEHRHLNHQRFTLAAIDDVIQRGCRQDWEQLRQALLQDSSLLGKVKQVCLAHAHEPYAQRQHFWLNYVQARQTAA